MECNGRYEDPSQRKAQGSGYYDGPVHSPDAPWRHDVPLGNQFGSLQDYYEETEMELITKTRVMDPPETIIHILRMAHRAQLP